MLTSNPTSLKAQLNQGNLNTLASKLQALQIGAMLLALPTSLRRKAAAVSPYVVAAEEVIPTPEDAKACVIFTAYARGGTGTKGPLTVVAGVPAAGQISMAPSGDIVTAAADAWTDLDVVYLPEKYDVVEITLPVAALTGIMALPPFVTGPGAVVLIEAEATAGTIVGKKIIDAPGTAPATLEAALSADKTTVVFNLATDVVTEARVKLGVASSVDVQALLEAVSATV